MNESDHVVFLFTTSGASDGGNYTHLINNKWEATYHEGNSMIKFTPFPVPTAATPRVQESRLTISGMLNIGPHMERSVIPYW